MSSSSLVPEDISDDDLRAEFVAFLPDFALPPILPHTRSVLLDKIRKVKRERKEGEKEHPSKWEDHLGSILKAPKTPKTPKPAPAPVTKVEKGDEWEEVSNYVFLDLEATGLASANPRTRITELSMVAVTKAQFETLRRDLEQLKFKSDPEAITPRALNKITMCFSPRTLIPPLVTSLTGLDNGILEDQGHFDTDAVDQIKCFLRRLVKPICLVAHNGKVFDLPLFMAEVTGCGGAMEDLGLLCMDSLVALKSIYAKERRTVDAEIAGVEAISVLGAFDGDDFCEEAGVSRMEWDEGGDASSYHSALSSPAGKSDSYHYPLPNTPPKSDPFEHAVSSPPVVHSFQSPDSSSEVPHMGAALASTTGGPGSDGDEEVTPERPIVAAVVPPPLSPKANKRAKLKRQSRPAPPTAATAAKSAKKRLDFDAPQSYSLPRLHEHLFGRAPVISHGAEADCLALMRVCARKGVRATTNSPDCFKLSAIKPMW